MVSAPLCVKIKSILEILVKMKCDKMLCRNLF